MATIGPYVFYGCSKLKSIDISSVKSIPSGCFQDCSSLIKVTLNPSLESIDNNPFKGCSMPDCLPIDITKINIQNNISDLPIVKLIIPSAESMIVIPSSITYIDSNIFANTSIPQIIIPSSVKSICDSAFERCNSFTQITLSSSITIIPKCSTDVQI